MKTIKSYIVHEFTMGDVEDPDLFAAQPMLDFEQSEKGRWVISHAIESPIWTRFIDYMHYGYRYKISAKFYETDLTYFLLKWN